MVARAVTRAWLVSRQQSPSRKQQLTQFLTEKTIECRPSPDERHHVDDAFDDDAAIDVEKRDDIVPLRRGMTAEASESDGFWTSHLFWKGIVLGVLVVTLVKMVFAVQTPFGVDWYGY